MLSPTISCGLTAMPSAPFTPPIRSLGPSYAHNKTYIRSWYDPHALFLISIRPLHDLAIGVYIFTMCGPIKESIWKCLLRDGKQLTKHMLTYGLLDPYEQISVKCQINILVIQWPSFRRCHCQLYSLPLKLWCFGFESWMAFIPRGTSQHWLGKWLATVSVTSHYLNVCWQSLLSLKCHVHDGGHFVLAKTFIKI